MASLKKPSSVLPEPLRHFNLRTAQRGRDPSTLLLLGGASWLVTSPLQPQFLHLPLLVVLLRSRVGNALPTLRCYRRAGRAPSSGADLPQPGKLYPNPSPTMPAKGVPPPAWLPAPGWTPMAPAPPSPIHSPRQLPHKLRQT